MKVLNKNDYQEIRTWIHRNARELELSVWNYFFENGSREAVIDALSYYCLLYTSPSPRDS